MIAAARIRGHHPAAPSLVPATIDVNPALHVLSDGAAVSAFADYTGNGHAATGGAVYKVAVVGGRNAYRLNGGKAIDWGNLSALFPSAATCICLVTVASNNYDLITTGVTDDFTRHVSGPGYNGAFRTARQNSYPASGMPTSGVHTFTFRSSSTKFDVRLDGTSLGAGTPSYSAGTNHSIGRVGADFIGGDVARVLLFASELSDAQCAAWEAVV